jgi:HlyD family secretion protein
MTVIIRSRLDESVTWSGTLEKIDWENTVSSSNNNYYYMSGDEMTTTTKYPFYVALDDYTGLLLGQHIYIEPDYGQTASRQGLWLPEYYIVREGNDAWVWAQGNRSHLEKRTLTLGETDDETGTVQVLAGLTGEDSIAFPEEGLHAGMTCIAYEETMFVDPSELPVSFEEDDAFSSQEFYPEEMPEAEPQESAETAAGMEEEPVPEGGAG